MATPKQKENYRLFSDSVKALSWAAEYVESMSGVKTAANRAVVRSKTKMYHLDERFSIEDRYNLARRIMAEVLRMPGHYKLLLLYACLGDRATPEWAATVDAVRQQLRQKGVRVPVSYKYTPEIIALYSGQPEWWCRSELQDAFHELSIRLGAVGIMEPAPDAPKSEENGNGRRRAKTVLRADWSNVG